MKVKFSKTKYAFSVERYPAGFGYYTSDGKNIDLGSGHVIIIRILGFKIKIDIIKKRQDV